MPPTRTTPTIDEVLSRAVAAGLIDRGTAEAIGALAEPTEPDTRATRPIPVAMEAIAYVGGSLLLIGAVVFVGQYWDQLTTGWRMGVLAAATVVLGAATLVVGESDEVRWRLRGFLGLLTAGGALSAALETTLEALDWEDHGVPIGVGATVTVVSALLWRWKDRPAQQLTTFLGIQTTVAGVTSWLAGSAGVGLSILAIGVVWLVATARDRLPSPPAALVMSLAAIGVGPAVTTGTWERPAPLIGLAVAVALVVAGSVRRQFLVMVAGVIALFVYLPWTIGVWFGETIGAPAVFMISGASMLVVVLWLNRARRRR